MKVSILYYLAFTSAYLSKREVDPCASKCVLQVEATNLQCLSLAGDEVELKKCVCSQDDKYWTPLVECVKECPIFKTQASENDSLEQVKSKFCATAVQSGSESTAISTASASSSSSGKSSTVTGSSATTGGGSSSTSSSGSASKTESKTSSKSESKAESKSESKSESKTDSESSSSSTSAAETTQKEGAGAQVGIDSLLGLLALALI